MSEEDGLTPVATVHGSGMTPDGYHAVLTFKTDGDEYISIAMPPEQVPEAVRRLCELPSEIEHKTESGEITATTLRAQQYRQIWFTADANPAGPVMMHVAFGMQSVVRIRMTRTDLLNLHKYMGELIEQMTAEPSDETVG